MLYIYISLFIIIIIIIIIIYAISQKSSFARSWFFSAFNKNRIAGRGFLHHRGVAPPRWTPAFSLVLGAPPTMMGSLMMVNTLPILDTLQKNKFFAG